jgi:adenine-specific DNA-methyltransferase
MSATASMLQYASADKPELYWGDAAVIGKTIPNESISLIFTSPPYNIGKSYEQRISLDQYLKQMSDLIGILVHKVRPDGSICWQVGNYVQDGEVFPLDIFYYDIFKRLGLKLRNRIAWHYGHGQHTKRRFSGRYEVILWFTKSDNYIFNLDDVRVPSKYPNKRHYKGPKKGELSGHPLGKNPSDVWEFFLSEWDGDFWVLPNVKSGHPEKTMHPCQFPIELAERCILALTNEGDTVYDPFAGVGTTLLAAYKHGRNGIGSEKIMEYIQIYQERLHKLERGVLPMRELGTPIGGFRS